MPDSPAAPRPRRRRPRPAPYLFLLPAAVLFVAFYLAPVGYAAVLSTRGETVTGGGLGLRTETFVGLANYRTALTDAELWHGLGRLLGYGAVVVPVMLGLALLFALLLDVPRVRARSFSRLAIFLPYAVPGVLASLLWGFMYLPSVSPLNELLALVGLGPVELLDGDGVLFAVANIAVWGGTGFNMVVLYTALRALPGELYDAARIDGCDELRLALRVKVPMVAPALVMTGVFSLIATLQVFNEPTTLKPLSNAISSTWMPLMKVYTDAYATGHLYQAAATSLLLALLSLALSLATLRAFQQRAFGDER